MLSGWLRSVFVLRSGAIGQAILFDLRRRGYDHIQALSVSFHERFTSGRVISRLTSDVDTLTELLDSGLDGLLTAVFNIAAISVLLLILDVPLGLIALASLVPLWLLYRWFSSRASVAFRRTRETVATMIVNIVESFNGIRAVQAFRREKRNDAIFAGLNDDYREANRQAFKLHAVFIPGTALIGNVATVAVLLVGGYRVADGTTGARCADLVHPVPAAVLRPDGGRRGLLQLAAVGERGPGEDLVGAAEGRRWPSPSTPVAAAPPVRGAV